ncbi:hypothetical protein D3C78_1329490 [compost metagenome]
MAKRFYVVIADISLVRWIIEIRHFRNVIPITGIAVFVNIISFEVVEIITALLPCTRGRNASRQLILAISCYRSASPTTAVESHAKH